MVAQKESPVLTRNRGYPIRTIRSVKRHKVTNHFPRIAQTGLISFVTSSLKEKYTYTVNIMRVPASLAQRRRPNKDHLQT
jgi:hypothetical protein